MTDHKGGGIDSLILLGELGANTDKIREKRAKAFQTDKRTVGLENLFFLTLTPEEGKAYDSMVGSIKVYDYPTFRNFEHQETNANMFFPWRAYTLTDIALLMDLRNSPEEKRYGSTNAFSAIANCSKTSIEQILKELATGGPKHAKVFHCYGKEQESDPRIGGAVFYNLTSNGVDFVNGFKNALIELNPSFTNMLDKYSSFIGKIVSDLTNDNIIFVKNVLGDRKGSPGSITHRYFHVKGLAKLAEAEQYHYAGHSRPSHL